MEKLLIYREDKGKFSTENLKKKLLLIKGVSNLNANKFIDSPLSLEFKYERCEVIVRLADDLETVIIDGFNDASLLFALKLQEIENAPLRIFNDQYDFHFSVQGIKSARKLKKKVQEHFFDEKAIALETAVI